MDNIKKCHKCFGKVFMIINIACCENCSENGAWDDEDQLYTTDMKVIEEKALERNAVDEQGECNLGSSFGAGCHMYRCCKCNAITNMPIIEGC